MHGYHPADPQSYAALLTNQPGIPDNIAAIPDIFRLMTHDAELASERNKTPGSDSNGPDSGSENPAAAIGEDGKTALRLAPL
jgi:hypothetical protein